MLGFGKGGKVRKYITKRTAIAIETARNRKPLQTRGGIYNERKNGNFFFAILTAKAKEHNTIRLA